jgi:hypothetical protein
MIPKLDVYNIIDSLRDKGVISPYDLEIKLMKGTTEGQVFILIENQHPKFVLKVDNPQEIEFVEQFLQVYRNVSLLPKLHYVDQAKEFILYTFKSGTTHINRGLKANWMKTLVIELMNHYEKVDESMEWGRLGIPRQSWYEFNCMSIDSAYATIRDKLPFEDYETVKSIVNRLGKYESESEKYLLHGDTGIHNFVFSHSTITGVIDPSPMIGPKIYDFTYAFCSSPDDLNLMTLYESVSALNISIDKERLIDEVVVQLYTRIGICIKAHPQDLHDYLKAWDYWKNLVSN